ncbi:MAG: hypothetical protein M1450_02760 [Patescibacteria group bacterium]|nr:hypothetical protein [Patescibacteria group bacterium]
MFKKITITKIIIGLIVFSFLFEIIFSLFSPNKDKGGIKPFPTPTTVSQPIPVFKKPATSPRPLPTLTEQDNNIQEEKVVSLMPVVSDAYNIEYLFLINTFVVTIKKSPISNKKEKTMEWFRNRGVNPDSPNIIYRKYRWVN